MKIKNYLLLAIIPGMLACSKDEEPIVDNQNDDDNELALQTVATAKTELEVVYADGEGANAVYNNVELVTSIDDDVLISWTSSDNSTVNSAGEVSRPFKETGNKQIQLTATLSFQDVSDTKVFLFTVVAYEQTIAIDEVLIADYSFDDQTASDATANENHGIMYSVTAATDRFGNANMAFDFDGTSSYIELPDGLLVQQDMTISLWCKTTSFGCMIGQQTNDISGGSPQWVPIMYVREDNSLNACFWSGRVTNFNELTNPINDGKWHHVVITSDAVGQNIYIDNVLTGTGLPKNVLDAMVHNQIGSGFTYGWNSSPESLYTFDGTLDDVKIANKALNLSEIEYLYRSTNPKSQE